MLTIFKKDELKIKVVCSTFYDYIKGKNKQGNCGSVCSTVFVFVFGKNKVLKFSPTFENFVFIWGFVKLLVEVMTQSSDLSSSFFYIEICIVFF